MKKYLLIIIFSLLLSSNTFAEIYKCEMHSNHSFVIKATTTHKQILATVENETGKFTGESTVLATEVSLGEIIEFKGKQTNNREILVLNNPKKGSQNSFRAVYFDGTGYPYVNTIRIDYWDEDHPIYFYNDWTNEITKGTCQ